MGGKESSLSTFQLKVKEREGEHLSQEREGREGDFLPPNYEKEKTPREEVKGAATAISSLWLEKRKEKRGEGGEKTRKKGQPLFSER